jgi:SAM-dependent methyltransferase
VSNLPGPIAATRSFARRWSRRLRRSYLARAPAGDVVADLDPAALDPAQSFTFRCNVCGTLCCAMLSALDREKPTCAVCGSNVRFRAIARLVACEIFGAAIALPDLPLAKHIRGIGLSDAPEIAEPLATRLDYVNTFLHVKPRLDIAASDVERYGGCDFIIASDVFEHVATPVSRAFENAYRLLKPGGKLIFSAPFTLDAETVEHFAGLHDWRVERRDGGWRLVNRAADGTVTTHGNLVFHKGRGAALEMRYFSRAALERDFARAGFARVRIADEPYLPFGIHWPVPWSVPMVAYR